MIVLDTNVVSEAMRPLADSWVINWLNRQPAKTLFLTSVTLAKLLFGIAALPEGKRKHALASTLDGLLKLLGERILPFETKSSAKLRQAMLTYFVNMHTILPICHMPQVPIANQSQLHLIGADGWILRCEP